MGMPFIDGAKSAHYSYSDEAHQGSPGPSREPNVFRQFRQLPGRKPSGSFFDQLVRYSRTTNVVSMKIVSIGEHSAA
jgi:hypothetical protein